MLWVGWGFRKKGAYGLLAGVDPGFDGRGDLLEGGAEQVGVLVRFEELGDLDTIAPAVSKGNDTLLAWVNETMAKLGSEKFFHADYEKTLLDVYGAAYEDTLVVEPGQK